MPIAPDVCGIIARQLARQLDSTASTYQPSAEPSDGGYWRTAHGALLSDLGPRVTPLAKRERVSLLGYINGKGASASEFASRMERLEALNDIGHATDMKLFEPHIPKGMTAEQQANWLQVLEQRSHEVDDYGVYKHEPGSARIAPMNAEIARFAEIAKQYFDNSVEERLRANIPQTATLPYYAPIMHRTDALTRAMRDENAMQSLAAKIARKDGRTTVTSLDLDAARLSVADYTGQQYATIGANIQRERLFDVGKDRVTDPREILSLYSKQHWRALNEMRVFGERDSIHKYAMSAETLIAGIKAENIGNEMLASAVDNYARDTFGIHPQDPTMNSALVRTLGTLQSLKLSMSVLKHFNLPINTWMRTDLPSTIKGVNALLTNSTELFGIPARDAAGMFGSVVANSLYESTLFQGGRLSDIALKYNGMGIAIKTQRALAGTVGAYYAQGQARNLARTGTRRYATALAELGIDPEQVVARGGELTHLEKMLAGQRVLNATQSRARMSDLPYFATNNAPLWRAILMFKNYPINQTRLMIDTIARKPARALMFGAAVMPSVGAVGTWMSNVFKEDIIGAPPSKRIDPNDAFGIYLEDAIYGGSFGYLQDLFALAWLQGGNVSVRGALEPAMLSTLEDVIGASGNLMHLKGRAFARDVGRQFGGLGAAMVRSILPSDEDNE